MGDTTTTGTGPYTNCQCSGAAIRTTLFAQLSLARVISLKRKSESSDLILQNRCKQQDLSSESDRTAPDTFLHLHAFVRAPGTLSRLPLRRSPTMLDRSFSIFCHRLVIFELGRLIEPWLSVCIWHLCAQLFS